MRGCDTEPPNLSKPRRHDKTQCTLSVERKLEGIAVCENTIEYPITPDRWIPYPHTWPTSNVLGTQSNMYQIFLATAECFISSQFNSNNLKHNLVVNFRFLGNIWRHCCFAILYHNIHLLWFGKCILLYLQNNNVLHLMPIVEKKKLPQYIVVHTLYIQCIYYTDYIAIENCQCSISENHSMQF